MDFNNFFKGGNPIIRGGWKHQHDTKWPKDSKQPKGQTRAGEA